MQHLPEVEDSKESLFRSFQTIPTLKADSDHPPPALASSEGQGIASKDRLRGEELFSSIQLWFEEKGICSGVPEAITRSLHEISLKKLSSLRQPLLS
jgi:hypothetical protein